MSNYTGSIPDTTTRTHDWLEHAACRDRSDEMFPDNDTHGIAAAKRICRPCPVWRECLLDALTTGDTQHGIRGGLTPAERRTIAKRANTEPIELPKPRTPRQPRPTTLTEAVRLRTVRATDGHLAWNGFPHVRFQGKRYTALQAAFIVGHGREPVGHVRRTCGEECFGADHLTDQVMRDAEDRCGTRSGYLRHRARGEDCETCRRANTDADNRLRRTGTTKELTPRRAKASA